MRISYGALRDALTRPHGLATPRPACDDTLAEHLTRVDVTPTSIAAPARSYGMEARRAGWLPEEMVIQLKQLCVSIRPRLGVRSRRSERLFDGDAPLSFIVSQAIDAYFSAGDAHA
jgi:hypothetical protein